MVLGLPWQIVVPDGEGVAGVPTVGVTFMVIRLDVAGLPVAQVALDVISTVIRSPFANAEDE